MFSLIRIMKLTAFLSLMTPLARAETPHVYKTPSFAFKVDKRITTSQGPWHSIEDFTFNACQIERTASTETGGKDDFFLKCAQFGELSFEGRFVNDAIAVSKSHSNREGTYRSWFKMQAQLYQKVPPIVLVKSFQRASVIEGPGGSSFSMDLYGEQKVYFH